MIRPDTSSTYMTYHSLVRVLLVEMNNQTRLVTKFTKCPVGLRKCQNLSGYSGLKILIQPYPTAYVKPHPTKQGIYPEGLNIHTLNTCKNSNVCIVHSFVTLNMTFHEFNRFSFIKFFLSSRVECKNHRVSSGRVWKSVLWGRVGFKVSLSCSPLITSISANYDEQFGQFVKHNSLHCKTHKYSTSSSYILVTLKSAK